MRILVYGAGVIGCELAHMLKKTSHEVTILARGDWKRTLSKNGLTIHHYATFCTSHDQVRVIEKLKSEDNYDLIFVVMRQDQVSEVLPVLSRNNSEYVMFIGNNLNAPEIEESLKQNSISHKDVAFGFQNTGGRREQDKVVSLHTKVGMTAGAIDGELSREFKRRLSDAFAGSGYRLRKEKHMDAWLKCHAAFILPACYICYQRDGKIRRTSKAQINQMIDAVMEAHTALKALGYPIRPDGEEEFFINDRKKCYRILWILLKTPIGSLAVSAHAMRAKGEFKMVDEALDRLWKKAGCKMTAWNELRESSGIKKEDFVNG